MPDISGPQLMSTIERAENVNTEMEALKEDLKEIFADAKDKGMNPKYIKKVIALRKKDPEERRMEDAELLVYMEHAGLA